MEKEKGKMTVWDMAVDAVTNHGTSFRVDIIGRNFTLGKRKVIENGVWQGDLGIDESMSVDDVLMRIEDLYADYYVSMESKRSHRSLFGHSTERKTREDFMFAEYTNVAQLKLELFVLLSVLSGVLVWTEERFGKKWYWQSERYPSLVINKSWICGNS